MREIKFRAWVKHENRMTAGPYDGDFIKWHAPSNWNDHYEVMQYTGLKDKNGKEIYEGDIDGSDEPMYVAFENGSFGLKFKNKSNYFDNCINWDMCEIIGNIYEQPHLLEHRDDRTAQRSGGRP